MSLPVSNEVYGPPSTNVKVKFTPHNRGPGFWQVTSIDMSIHTGAHIDSALHVTKGGATTDQFSLDQVIGDAVVLDLTHVADNEEITREHLEKCNANIRTNDIILLNTGWSDKTWMDFPRYFVDSPYLSVDASRWLVERKPKAIGVDFFEEYSARLKDFTSEDFVVHKEILDSGIVLMEGLTNLSALPTERVQFFGPFVKFVGLEG
ncbi:MAG: cyclase family protein, partial [Bacillota bacterium]